MAEQSIIYVLGDKKIPLSAFIPAIIESSNKTILLASRNNLLDGIDLCILDNLNNMDYQIQFAHNDFNSLDSFLNDMKNHEKRAGVISYNSPLFLDMIESGNGGIWFSACREGLYETYLPIIEPHITKPTHICVFDNDTNIVNNAKENCRNPNIHFHQCIIHSVCSDIRYDYKEHAVHLTSGKECLLVFPPSMRYLNSEFEFNPFFNRADFQFTTSDYEFLFYAKWKMIAINALHTLAAVKAYMVGLQNGLSLSQISKECFSSFVSKDEMLKYLLKIHSLLYDKHLIPYAKYVKLSKDDSIRSATIFLEGLYNHQETIGRGLNVIHTSFNSKITSHFPLLKSANDLETITMLDNFLDMF